MAQSPAHRLGQIIGEELEAAVRKPLSAIAEEFRLYLDYRHRRPARGGKKKVAWTDARGNTHDLDYVLEEGGTEETFGRPRAFIEVAWRRYTKHSRNKAQEIQGTITPLADTFQHCHPFLGAVLAGDFTEGSLDQLRSHEFNLVYCPYDAIMHAFEGEGLDMSSDEDTSEADLWRKIDAFERLTSDRCERIEARIRDLHVDQLRPFFEALRRCLDRRIESIFVLPLSGTSSTFSSVKDAVRFVSGYDQSTPASEFVYFELNIRYSNRDEIRGTFREKKRAIDFLRSLEG